MSIVHVHKCSTPNQDMAINIQYWCIDRKYRIYVARLRNGGKTSF
jgi:hypothetical protein